MESEPMHTGGFRINLEYLSHYSNFIILLSFLLTMGYFIQKKVRSYCKNRSKLKSMAEKYERKRESRNELKFHFYWALDRGDRKDAMNIGNEIIQMDKELKEEYAQYQHYKEKGFYPLKKI